uniref:Ankyrin-2-like n=1 Tax=Petromyzon marinus TaxID=7757 RepID=A0AAJ7T9F9_PETMA|nr:ankyrin-2-like [Petromyzon marinus]
MGNAPLCAGGKSEDVDTEVDVNTSLLRAARAGNLEKVLELLKAGTDIHTTNQNGLNALHLAAKEGHVAVVKELLTRGSKVDSTTKKGNTALHIASLAGQTEVVTLLTEHGADVNAQSENGFTALYMAAQENHVAVVTHLLGTGANQAIATEDGFTPLAVALQQAHERVVELLLEGDARGRVRLPALHIAARKDDTRSAALLLHSGSNGSSSTAQQQPESEHAKALVNRTTESGFTPLHIAAHYGNVNVARLLLECGADPNYMANNGISPLHVAAKRGHSELVTLLLSLGGNIDARTRDGLTPLHCAARSGHDGTLEILLEQGAPILAKTKNGLSPLHMAAQGDHVGCVRGLGARDAPVDDATLDSLTALHVAAHCGHYRSAKLLLELGAEPDARALNGFTPLHIASKKNRARVVELLLRHRATIGAVTESGLTPLHVAAFMGNLEVVSLLLQYGATLDTPNVRGETPLHMAARAGQLPAVKSLLKAGADPHATTRDEQTALHLASRLPRPEVALALLEAGARTDAVSAGGYTPLHISARAGHTLTTASLLHAGADHTLPTRKGFTPLHVAAKYGQTDVVRLLLEGGAQTDITGKNGLTPLHVAAHYDHQEVALVLLQNGASPTATAKNGYTPLHIASRKGQDPLCLSLLSHGADVDAHTHQGVRALHLCSQQGHGAVCSTLLTHGAQHTPRTTIGLTPMHLAAQEDRVEVAQQLEAHGAPIDPVTKLGYTPLIVACHYGNAPMVEFLLRNGADVNHKTKSGYTPLHQAAQQGHTHIVSLLLKHGARPDDVTNGGNTALSIANRLGYISVVDTLQAVTTETQTVTMRHRLSIPETMTEMLDVSDDDVRKAPSRNDVASDTDEGDGAPTLHPDDILALTDDSLPDEIRLSELRTPARSLGAASSTGPFASPGGLSLSLMREAPLSSREDETSLRSAAAAAPPQVDYEVERAMMRWGTPEHWDNVTLSSSPMHSGACTPLPQYDNSFLVSFLVDARGGSMRGCRPPGLRLLVPPGACASPTRVTCRLAKQQPPAGLAPGDTQPQGPPVVDGEGLAARIIQLGPPLGRFLGPVLLEAPHYASLRGGLREVVVLRSNDGATWAEHKYTPSDEELHQLMAASNEDLEGESPMLTRQSCRVLTKDFPKFLALVSRITMETGVLGPQGGALWSRGVPGVRVAFPEGALTRQIRLGLQAQAGPDAPARDWPGNRVTFGPVVTLEPRRRKFHRPITVTMPLPQPHGTPAETTPPRHHGNLRLLCSIAGGVAPAVWEDITDTTPLTVSGDSLTFHTSVSARFWPVLCTAARDAPALAPLTYGELSRVPYLAHFRVWARRHDTDPRLARLSCACACEERDAGGGGSRGGAPARARHTQLARSKTVEVLDGAPLLVSCQGNLTPLTPRGQGLSLPFHAFRENRLSFSVKVRDPSLEPCGRLCFYQEPRAADATPVCSLNITLPPHEPLADEDDDEPLYDESDREYLTPEEGAARLSRAIDVDAASLKEEGDEVLRVTAILAPGARSLAEASSVRLETGAPADFVMKRDYDDDGKEMSAMMAAAIAVTRREEEEEEEILMKQRAPPRTVDIVHSLAFAAPGRTEEGATVVTADATAAAMSAASEEEEDEEVEGLSSEGWVVFGAREVSEAQELALREAQDEAEDEVFAPTQTVRMTMFTHRTTTLAKASAAKIDDVAAPSPRFDDEPEEEEEEVEKLACISLSGSSSLEERGAFRTPPTSPTELGNTGSRGVGTEVKRRVLWMTRGGEMQEEDEGDVTMGPRGNAAERHGPIPTDDSAQPEPSADLEGSKQLELRLRMKTGEPRESGEGPAQEKVAEQKPPELELWLRSEQETRSPTIATTIVAAVKTQTEVPEQKPSSGSEPKPDLASVLDVTAGLASREYTVVTESWARGGHQGGGRGSLIKRVTTRHITAAANVRPLVSATTAGDGTTTWKEGDVEDPETSLEGIGAAQRKSGGEALKVGRAEDSLPETEMVSAERSALACEDLGKHRLPEMPEPTSLASAFPKSAEGPGGRRAEGPVPKLAVSMHGVTLPTPPALSECRAVSVVVPPGRGVGGALKDVGVALPLGLLHKVAAAHPEMTAHDEEADLAFHNVDGADVDGGDAGALVVERRVWVRIMVFGANSGTAANEEASRMDLTGLVTTPVDSLPFEVFPPQQPELDTEPRLSPAPQDVTTEPVEKFTPDNVPGWSSPEIVTVKSGVEEPEPLTLSLKAPDDAAVTREERSDEITQKERSEVSEKVMTDSVMASWPSDKDVKRRVEEVNRSRSRKEMKREEVMVELSEEQRKMREEVKLGVEEAMSLMMGRKADELDGMRSEEEKIARELYSTYPKESAVVEDLCEDVVMKPAERGADGDTPTRVSRAVLVLKISKSVSEEPERPEKTELEETAEATEREESVVAGDAETRNGAEWVEVDSDSEAAYGDLSLKESSIVEEKEALSPAEADDIADEETEKEEEEDASAEKDPFVYRADTTRSLIVEDEEEVEKKLTFQGETSEAFQQDEETTRRQHRHKLQIDFPRTVTMQVEEKDDEEKEAGVTRCVRMRNLKKSIVYQLTGASGEHVVVTRKRTQSDEPTPRDHGKLRSLPGEVQRIFVNDDYDSGDEEEEDNEENEDAAERSEERWVSRLTLGGRRKAVETRVLREEVTVRKEKVIEISPFGGHTTRRVTGEEETDKEGRRTREEEAPRETTELDGMEEEEEEEDESSEVPFPTPDTPSSEEVTYEVSTSAAARVARAAADDDDAERRTSAYEVEEAIPEETEDDAEDEADGRRKGGAMEVVGREMVTMGVTLCRFPLTKLATVVRRRSEVEREDEVGEAEESAVMETEPGGIKPEPVKLQSEKLEAKLEPKPEAVKRVELESKPEAVKLEPKPESVKLQLEKLEAKLEPKPEAVKRVELESKPEAVKLEPKPESVKLQLEKLEAKLEPKPEAVKRVELESKPEALKLEPKPESVKLQLEKLEAKLEPKPEAVKRVELESKSELVKLKPKSKPVKLESKPQPVKIEPKPDPVKLEPKPEPVKLEPKSKPVKLKPEPVKLETSPELVTLEPVRLEPKPEPVKLKLKPDPVKLEQKPKPVKLETKPEPVELESKPEPAKLEPKPEPVELESVELKLKPEPVKLKQRPEPVTLKPEPVKLKIKPESVKFEHELVKLEPEPEKMEPKPETVKPDPKSKPVTHKPEPVKLEQRPEPVTLKPEPVKLETKPAKLEPKPEPVTLELVKLEPKPEPVKLQPKPEPVELEPKPEPVKLKQKTKPAKPEPKPEPVKLEAGKLEPKPEPVKLQPKPEPVELEPKPEPVKLQPKPEQVKLEPVKLEPKPEPVKLQPKPEPVELEQKPKPVKLEPKPEPEKLEAEPEKLELKPEPVKLEPKLEPVKVESKLKPVKVEPKLEPVKLEPKPEPVKLEPKLEPVKVEPKLEPVKLEPKPEPVKLEPEQVKVEPEPVKLEPKLEPVKLEPKLEPVKVEPKPEPVKLEPEPVKLEPKPVKLEQKPEPIKLEPKPDLVKLEPKPVKLEQKPEPMKLEPKPDLMKLEQKPVKLETKPAKLEPKPQPIKLELKAEPVELESKPVKLKPEPVKLKQKTEPAKLKPKPAKPEPKPEPVKLEAGKLEPKPESVKFQPKPEPVELEPKPEPVKLQPKPEPVKLEPVKLEPKPEMVKLKLKPEPVKLEQKPGKLEPKPEPVKLEAVKLEPKPVKVEQKLGPVKVEPKPGPVKLESKQEPVKPEAITSEVKPIKPKPTAQPELRAESVEREPLPVRSAPGAAVADHSDEIPAMGPSPIVSSARRVTRSGAGRASRAGMPLLELRGLASPRDPAAERLIRSPPAGMLAEPLILVEPPSPLPPAAAEDDFLFYLSPEGSAAAEAAEEEESEEEEKGGQGSTLDNRQGDGIDKGGTDAALTPAKEMHATGISLRFDKRIYVFKMAGTGAGDIAESMEVEEKEAESQSGDTQDERETWTETPEIVEESTRELTPLEEKSETAQGVSTDELTSQDTTFHDATSRDTSSQYVTSLDVTPLDVTPLDVTPLNVTSLDVTSLDVTSLDVTSLDVTPFNVTSLDVTSLDVTPLNVTSLDVTSLDVTSLDLTCHEVTSRESESSDYYDVAEEMESTDGSVSDSSWGRGTGTAATTTATTTEEKEKKKKKKRTKVLVRKTTSTTSTSTTMMRLDVRRETTQTQTEWEDVRRGAAAWSRGAECHSNGTTAGSGPQPEEPAWRRGHEEMPEGAASEDTAEVEESGTVAGFETMVPEEADDATARGKEMKIRKPTEAVEVVTIVPGEVRETQKVSTAGPDDEEVDEEEAIALPSEVVFVLRRRYTRLIRLLRRTVTRTKTTTITMVTLLYLMETDSDIDEMLRGDLHLALVAEKLDSDWPALAEKMGISPDKLKEAVQRAEEGEGEEVADEVEELGLSKEAQKAFCLLKLWAHREGSRATGTQLERYLVAMKRPDVAQVAAVGGSAPPPPHFPGIPRSTTGPEHPTLEQTAHGAAVPAATAAPVPKIHLHALSERFDFGCHDDDADDEGDDAGDAPVPAHDDGDRDDDFTANFSDIFAGAIPLCATSFSSAAESVGFRNVRAARRGHAETQPAPLSSSLASTPPPPPPPRSSTLPSRMSTLPSRPSRPSQSSALPPLPPSRSSTLPPRSSAPPSTGFSFTPQRSSLPSASLPPRMPPAGPSPPSPPAPTATPTTPPPAAMPDFPASFVFTRTTLITNRTLTSPPAPASPVSTPLTATATPLTTTATSLSASAAPLPFSAAPSRSPRADDLFPGLPPGVSLGARGFPCEEGFSPDSFPNFRVTTVKRTRLAEFKTDPEWSEERVRALMERLERETDGAHVNLSAEQIRAARRRGHAESPPSFGETAQRGLPTPGTLVGYLKERATQQPPNAKEPSSGGHGEKGGPGGEEVEREEMKKREEEMKREEEG